jgi:hypothetical protein
VADADEDCLVDFEAKRRLVAAEVCRWPLMVHTR